MKKAQIKNQYVKLQIKNKKVWVKLEIDSKGIPIKAKNGLSIGTSLKNNVTYVFFPSDVIAYFEGDIKDFTGLGMAYIPTASTLTILDTIVPDSMGYETHIAMRTIQIKINKPIYKYVAEKLHYSEVELQKSLSAEQTDAVALAIYNIEEREQGMIIGDQTGIGKGRVAAAMIRYGFFNGLKPIFLSEKPNLFTDIYRDLSDIGSSNLAPFIINSKEAKSDIKDNEGNVVYSAPQKTEQDRVFKSLKLPKQYNFVCSTYSQFSSPEKNFVKPAFLKAVAQGNLIIMDESHNASGSSNTGAFLQDVLKNSKGVVFLSATFAKRPDNMPVYAMKTAISDANMTSEDLVEAIKKGGVALQEVLASQLVSEGQMIRRERSFEGVEVNYITLTEKEIEHKAVYDNITSVLRDIIDFQENHISGKVGEMDGIAAAEGAEVETTKGTNKAGVDNQPYFSRVFQVVNQMLFSIKAKDVAEKAIERLNEGKKPVIAFSSTMKSFFDSMEHDDGRPIAVGDTVNLDYGIVLEKGLRSVMKYTLISANGDREVHYFDVAELEPEGQAAYFEILQKIKSINTGLSISPIDVIKETIRNAGYTCDEVTGRKYEVQSIDKKKGNYGVLLNRKKILANDAFRMYNDNELDCLLINQSGSTGASAHAIVTKKVPAGDVKQRVMIVLQPELDINREVQKRGRINRTGQILKPIYDYVSSAIPAEKRLMMMLQKKLKSLDANTTSNQKQSEDMMKTDDFLNKFGDIVVTEYILENPELNKKIGDPLNLDSDNNDKEKTVVLENAASKVSGRVAVLPTTEQEKFYMEIIEKYDKYVKFLKQSGEYDLEIEALNFEAETKEIKTGIEGKSGSSVFSENTFLEKVEVNNLKKPFTTAELENIIIENLNGKDAKDIQAELIEEVKDYYTKKALLDIDELEKKYEKLIQNIDKEKKYQKLKTQQERIAFENERTDELLKAKKDAEDLMRKKANNTFGNIHRVLNFFYIGRVLFFPAFFDERAKAVCVGYNVDRKKNNPFAPSAMEIKIAIANSDKYLEITLSGDQAKKLAEIMGYSQGIDSWVEKDLLKNWEYDCRASNVGRKTVYIVTGNILQGYSKYTGKLISFTTKDGSIRKGILLPDNYDPVKTGENYVNVPINKAVDYLKNMSPGSEVKSGKISIHKTYHGSFKFYVPATRNFQEYFKDLNIISLSNNKRDGFDKISNQMLAVFDSENIEELANYLGKKFNLSIKLHQNVYNEYFDTEQTTIKVKTPIQEKAEKIFEIDKQKFEERKNVGKSIPKQNSDKDKRLRIAKVKAAAKLKLLKLIA